MTRRLLAASLVVWAVVTVIAAVSVRAAFSLHIDEAHPIAIVESVWDHGEIVARQIADDEARAEVALQPVLDSRASATLVEERVVGEGPIVARPEAAFALSFVSVRDGLSATLDGHTVYVTPDELLARQAYDKDIHFQGIDLGVGVDVPMLLAMAADRLGRSVHEVETRALLRRIRVARVVRRQPPRIAAPAPRTVTAETLADEDVRDAVLAAARYLARSVRTDGRFRYLVDAPTNKNLPGYDWPRHAGATYFLAQVAGETRDAQISWAALRAASHLRDHALVDCGTRRCIGEAHTADLGSTALSLLAFVEAARSELDPAYALIVPKLTDFLRSQQRADGEFMHFYDRRSSKPVDKQTLYYSGEAAFALARAHALLGDPRDLEAATRALSYLVGPGWSFFGSRYYWGEEHWTCQAMSDLWERAPSPKALDFCLRWESFSRKLMYAAGETPFDADGAYGVGPLVVPHLTPVGSRTEAGIATLVAAARAGRPPAEVGPLELQMRRSLAVLLRHQIRLGRLSYLLANPEAVDGAMPSSEADWELRIDYAQHTGSALIRWLAWRGAWGEPGGGRGRGDAAGDAH